MSAMKELYTLTQFMHEEFPAAIWGWGRVEYFGESGFNVYHEGEKVLTIQDYDEFAELIRKWCRAVETWSGECKGYWLWFAHDYRYDPYHADYDGEILDSIIRFGSFGES